MLLFTLPAAHAVHNDAAVKEYRPGTQNEQLCVEIAVVASSSSSSSSSLSSSSTRPVENRPDWHPRHDVAPSSTPVAEPAGQSLQLSTRAAGA